VELKETIVVPGVRPSETRKGKGIDPFWKLGLRAMEEKV
jgi:hypothetical protein